MNLNKIHYYIVWTFTDVEVLTYSYWPKKQKSQKINKKIKLTKEVVNKCTTSSFPKDFFLWKQQLKVYVPNNGKQENWDDQSNLTVSSATMVPPLTNLTNKLLHCYRVLFWFKRLTIGIVFLKPHVRLYKSYISLEH